ncbi:MAG TPA: hypothetical protein VFH72_03335 [Candidatus Baltobacteraceae bacterium]|nr:hypothetical protein [Candidatus Baltobacteraceae bacterium]
MERRKQALYDFYLVPGSTAGTLVDSRASLIQAAITLCVLIVATGASVAFARGDSGIAAAFEVVRSLVAAALLAALQSGVMWVLLAGAKERSPFKRLFRLALMVDVVWIGIAGVVVAAISALRHSLGQAPPAPGLLLPSLGWFVDPNSTAAMLLSFVNPIVFYAAWLLAAGLRNGCQLKNAAVALATVGFLVCSIGLTLLG